MRMESANKSGMQSSSRSGGVGGLDQEYESGSATAVVGGDNKYNQNLMLLNNNIFDVTSMEYSSSSPQLELPYSFYRDPSFPNLVLHHPQIQPQPQPQPQPDRVVAAGTSSCTSIRLMNASPPPSASSSAAAGVTESGGNKNPRKRTRSSRKAPTTVMTTDTTNFRAMVQEFTGVPSSLLSYSPQLRPTTTSSGIPTSYYGTTHVDGHQYHPLSSSSVRPTAHISTNNIIPFLSRLPVSSSSSSSSLMSSFSATTSLGYQATPASGSWNNILKSTDQQEADHPE